MIVVTIKIEKDIPAGELAIFLQNLATFCGSWFPNTITVTRPN